MNGIERIKVLASEIKDKAVLKIVNYLLTREDMSEKYLNSEKSLKQMISFIKSNAKKEAHDGMAMIEDEVVYGWAIHYWDESNKDLNIDSLPKTKVHNDDLDNDEEDITRKAKANTKKDWVPEGQLTLFDM